MALSRADQRSTLDGQVALLLGKPGKSLTALVEARAFLVLRLSEVEGELERLRGFLNDLEAGMYGSSGSSEIEFSVALGLAVNHLRRIREQPSYGERVLAVVSEKPGLTGSEIARESGILPSRIYRVLRRLGEKGRVRRDGYVYFPGY